jgi:hypothetical protein
MSNNPLQRIADLEAQVAEERAEKEDLGRRPREATVPDAGAMAESIATAIDARLIRTEQRLREDFVMKFAALFEPIIERTTNRTVALERRLDEAGASQEALEGRLQAHLDEVGARLSDFTREQDGRLIAFSTALESHHAKNDEALALLHRHVQACNSLAQATVRAAETCQGFERDYEGAVVRAEGDRVALVKRAEGELAAFARQVKEKLSAVVEPTLREAERQARSRLRRHAEWAGALALGAVVMFGLMWLASPDGSAAVDAARWRRWQGGFTQSQAERMNRMLDQFEREEQSRAQGR